MSQHDFTIDNQFFPATRADINAALAALASVSSGSSAPTTTYAGMLWYDTTNAVLKQRDAANAAWITLWTVPTTTNEVKLPGGTLRVESTAPVLAIKDTDAGTNEKGYQIAASGTQLEVSTRTDADAAGATVLKASRSGTTVSGVQVGGTGVWGNIGYFSAGGSSNAFTGTLAPALAAYTTGLMVSFFANHSITGAATLNLNGLGAKNLKTSVGGTMASGDISSGQLVIAWYDGTDFRCIDGVWNTATVPQIYQSGEITVAAGDSGTITHSLGTTTPRASLYLRCKTAEGGYSVGDEIGPFNLEASIWGADRTWTYRPSSSNAIAYKIGGGGFTILNASTGASFGITPANWRGLIVVGNTR